MEFKDNKYMKYFTVLKLKRQVNIKLLFVGLILILNFNVNAKNEEYILPGINLLLNLFSPSIEQKQQDEEFESIKKNVKRFTFNNTSKENIKNFNALYNQINDFMKKYPKSKKRIKMLQELKENMEQYLPAIKAYNDLEKSKTLEELDENLANWNAVKSNSKNINVTNFIKNSEPAIAEFYQNKLTIFEEKNKEKEKKQVVITEKTNIGNTSVSSSFKGNTQKSNAPKSNVYFRSCKEAKARGYYNIRRGQPGYRSGLDRDGDGIACER